MSEICVCGKEFEKKNQLVGHEATCKEARFAKREAEVQEVRSKRIPLGTPQLKMTAHTPPGKVGHWINGDPGRLEQAQKGGWDFVRDPNAKTGDTPENTNTDLGSNVSMVVDKQTGKRAYWMVIDEELYAEDQKAKEAELKKIEDTITNPKPAEGQYIPKSKSSFGYNDIK